MGRWDIRPLYNLLKAMGPQERAAFVIQSSGGNADTAHLMLNLLREYVKHLDVFIPTYAASAATLFALGADVLWMGPSSEISPIDPQVPVDIKLLVPAADPAELPTDERIPVPAHVIKDFLELMGVIESPVHRPRMDPSRLEPLLKPLNPWILGWYERADKVSRLYAKAGLVNHLLRDVPEDARDHTADQIIEALLDGYASHEAGILRSEARTMGIPVSDCPEDVWADLEQLAEFYDAVARTQNVARIVETTDGFHASAAFATRQCEHCEEVSRREDEFRFCPSCGKPFMRECGTCQGRLEDDWNHCARCGAPVPNDHADDASSTT